MARSIRHTNIKGKRGRKPRSKETEPDFYSTDGASQDVSAPFSEEVLSGSSVLRPHEPRTTGATTSRRSSDTGLSRLEEAKRGEAKVGESKVGEFYPRDTLLSSTFYRNPPTRLTQSLVQNDLRWQPAGSMQSLGMQQARSLLLPVSQHADARMSSGSDQGGFQSQFPGNTFHHQPQQTQGPPSSFHLESTIPAPQLARQSSDFSIGAGSIFGVLGDSPPDGVAGSFGALEHNQARNEMAGMQSQSGLPAQLPSKDHQ